MRRRADFVLSETGNGNNARFRCHVAHARAEAVHVTYELKQDHFGLKTPNKNQQLQIRCFSLLHCRTTVSCLCPTPT